MCTIIVRSKGFAFSKQVFIPEWISRTHNFNQFLNLTFTQCLLLGWVYKHIWDYRHFFAVNVKLFTRSKKITPGLLVVLVKNIWYATSSSGVWNCSVWIWAVLALLPVSVGGLGWWDGGMPLDRGRKKNPTSDRMLRWTGSILAWSVYNTDITSEYHVALFIFGVEHRWTDCDDSYCDSSASLETAHCPGHSFEKEALSGVATLWSLIQNKCDVGLHNCESCN